MDNNNLRPASEFLNEMMNNITKDLKWHQKLRLRMGMKIDDVWTWFLINVVYRKYKS